MAQRFNPPPGWDVPRDFVPTSDWQPDPSWPPAPEGWTYWVEDTAPAADPTPSYGAASQDVPSYGSVSQPGAPSYGSASQPQGAPPAPSYGAPDGGQVPAGAPYGDQSAYGQPAAGAFGSTAAGSAQTAMLEAQVASARKAIIGGSIAFTLGVIITGISLASRSGGVITYGLILVGLVIVIKGLVDMNKAKKALAAQGPYAGAPAAFGGASAPGGFGGASAPQQPTYGQPGQAQPGQQPTYGQPGYGQGQTPPGVTPPGS